MKNILKKLSCVMLGLVTFSLGIVGFKSFETNQVEAGTTKTVSYSVTSGFGSGVPTNWTGSGGGSYCGGYGKNKANAWSVTLDFTTASGIDWKKVDFTSTVSLDTKVKAAGNSASGNVVLSLDNQAGDSVSHSISSDFGNGSNANSAKEVAMDISSVSSKFNKITINFPSKTFITAFSCTLSYTELADKSVTSISTLSADVSAKTGDTEWTLTNVSCTGVLSDSADVVDILSYVTITVAEEVPTINDDGTVPVTLKATSNSDSNVSKTVNKDATLTFVDLYSIERLYSLAKGDAITFDGIYMGSTRDGYIVMNGEYGMLAYFGNGSVPTDHGFTAGSSYVTVSGTLSIYNNLYETSRTPTVSALTDANRISHVKTPVVYKATGNESTADLTIANRKTNATGVVNSITDNSGNKTISFTVNGKDLKVFVGSAFINADATIVTKLNDSKDNGTEITIEGFTSFYTNFQIAFTNFVETSSDYLATNFASDFLAKTNEVCSAYDGTKDNEDSLNTVWLELNSSNYYLKLAASEKEILVNASTSGTEDINLAMARYDYLVAKYGLTNFIDRTIASSQRVLLSTTANQNSMIIISIVAVTSVTMIGVLLVTKRRRALVK